MKMPHSNTDPFAPVTRAELQAELSDIRETLARHGERLEHVATTEYVLNVVLKATLGTVGVIAAMLSIAVGILLRFG